MLVAGILVGMDPQKVLHGRPVPRGFWYVCAALCAVSLFACLARAESQASSTASIKIEALGKGAAPLDGPWQFHLGDNPAWANPEIDDATGHDGWEQLKADAPWGAQTHANTEGYGWYRRHIDLTLAPGAPSDVALLIPAIDDMYELYWNGQPVGHLGSFPPRVDFQSFIPAQTYGLGPVRSGVLAVRVYKAPFASNDDGTAGGFEGVPIIGSPQAIAVIKDSLDYKWLRGQQSRFALTGLYGIVCLLSFFAWMRDRRQRLLLWMAAYALMPTLELFLNGMRLQVS
ncbi:MAG: hypothetical protein JF563_06755, partial [Acidobacteriales bacterium]|nr:hypothetical protein [Terriglobales bacterium]